MNQELATAIGMAWCEWNEYEFDCSFEKASGKYSLLAKNGFYKSIDRELIAEFEDKVRDKIKFEVEIMFFAGGNCWIVSRYEPRKAGNFSIELPDELTARCEALLKVLEGGQK